jgi:signal transduction histidine kinase
MWLNRLLNVLKQEMADHVKERNQILEINDFPGSNEMIFADTERIHKALTNILTNAIKYTPDGGKITVEGRLLSGFVEILVTDTGIGIAEEDQTRIFEKFGGLGDVSLHSSGKTKFKGGGPGLGLPITKGILEAHGGSIWVESDGCDEENLPGSTFHILIPLRKEPPDDQVAKLFEATSDAGQESKK